MNLFYFRFFLIIGIIKNELNIINNLKLEVVLISILELLSPIEDELGEDDSATLEHMCLIVL